MKIEAIAHIEAPRDGGSAIWSVVFESKYRDRNALRGIESFSNLWLIWAAVGSEELQLTVVELEGVESVRGCGAVLRVGGVGLADGVPVFDIKPYIPYTDAHPGDAREDAR